MNILISVWNAACKQFQNCVHPENGRMHSGFCRRNPATGSMGRHAVFAAATRMPAKPHFAAFLSSRNPRRTLCSCKYSSECFLLQITIPSELARKTSSCPGIPSLRCHAPRVISPSHIQTRKNALSTTNHISSQVGTQKPSPRYPLPLRHAPRIVSPSHTQTHKNTLPTANHASLPAGTQNLIPP